MSTVLLIEVPGSVHEPPVWSLRTRKASVVVPLGRLMGLVQVHVGTDDPDTGSVEGAVVEKTVDS